MKFLKIIAMMFLLAVNWVDLFGLAADSTDENVKIQINANRFSIGGLPGDLAASGELMLYDGKSGQYLPLKPVAPQNGNSIVLTCLSPAITWKINFIPRQKMILIDSDITNSSGGEIRIEPTLKIVMKNAAAIKRCWDGFNEEYDFGKKEIGHKGIKGAIEKHAKASSRPFPSVAVFYSGKAFFIGGVPFEPVSYEAASISPPVNGTSTLKYSIRNAILPGISTNVKFVIGAENAEFGGKEAVVQAYYESFPELWAPAVGEDNPYLWGQHGEYMNWKAMPNYELTRRLYVVNEWTYCPYKRSGDAACRKELWDYTPLGKWTPPQVQKKQMRYDKLSRDEFLAFRKDVFTKYGQIYGLMFYLNVAGTWCEKQLAETKYPDAMVNDKDVPCLLQRWSIPHDNEVRVFPMGTSFAKAMHEDIKYLAKELDLPGFAFDCSYSGAFYRGPAVKENLPGRAWDEKGVFIDQSVAINNLVDYIRSVKTENNKLKKLFIFANGYLKADYLMMEMPFLGVGTYKSWFPRLRYYIGPRPVTTHGHGYLLKETVPNWREKTTEDFNEFMPKLADYVIFNCFKYASFPASYTICNGVPQTVYILPELIEMVRNGWQAEIPIRFSDNALPKMYTARYGKGIDSHLFVGNPYPQDALLDMKVKCDYLGAENCLFVRKMRKTADTRLSVSGREVALKTNFKSRVPVLFETVCGITPVKTPYACRATGNKDIDRQSFSLKFTTSTPFNARLSFRKIRNFELASVKKDGAAPPLNPSMDEVEIKNGTVIDIEYKSTRFEVTEKQLLAFPFVGQDKKVLCKIAIPASPGQAEIEAAERMQEYFKFCAEKGVIDRNSPAVEIVRTGSTPASGNWIAIAAKDKDSIRISGSVLYIEGRDVIELVKAAEYVMDERFPYIFPFKESMGIYNYQLDHFKMNGKYLPYQKYFESTAEGESR